MSMSHARFVIPLSMLGCLPAMPAAALLPAVYSFSTGDPDGKIATASRPESTENSRSSPRMISCSPTTSITSATFTGLVPGGGERPPTSSSRSIAYFPRLGCRPHQRVAAVLDVEVPTRVNSPSDVAFLEADSATGGLVLDQGARGDLHRKQLGETGGIYPEPESDTGGNGAVTGEEVRFDRELHRRLAPPRQPLFLRASGRAGQRQFLLAVGAEADRLAGTPFPPGFTDLQSWTRDDSARSRLAAHRHGHRGRRPAPTFNAAFSLAGSAVPEPSTWAMMLLGFAGLGFAGYRRARKARPASA